MYNPGRHLPFEVTPPWGCLRPGLSDGQSQASVHSRLLLPSHLLHLLRHSAQTRKSHEKGAAASVTFAAKSFLPNSSVNSRLWGTKFYLMPGGREGQHHIVKAPCPFILCKWELLTGHPYYLGSRSSPPQAVSFENFHIPLYLT